MIASLGGSLYSICRGIGNRVGQPRRRQLYKTKMGRLGCSCAELGMRTADCQRQLAYRLLTVGPGATGPPLLKSRTKQPTGPQLGRVSLGTTDCQSAIGQAKS